MKRITSKTFLIPGLCLWLLSAAGNYAGNSNSRSTIKNNSITTDQEQETESSQTVKNRQPRTGETIDWQVLSSGGMNRSSSANYFMDGTLAQTGVGNSASQGHEVGHGFWPNPFGSGTCCVGQTGDANCQGGDEPDVSDIVRIIDFLYLSKAPLCCPEEADATGNGGEPDISDIVRLIDYLYLETHTPPAPCP